MPDLFQAMCELLDIKRLSSTAFNPKMQDKVEKFHLGLNQTLSHYVNKYGNDWDEFIDYALMAHQAVPHSATKYSPHYLLYGREMRLPSMEDVTVPGSKISPPRAERVTDHLNVLKERLEEACRVVIANNQTALKQAKRIL
jgi:hypothetical protein